jgi:hypothetical protein
MVGNETKGIVVSHCSLDSFSKGGKRLQQGGGLSLLLHGCVLEMTSSLIRIPGRRAFGFAMTESEQNSVPAAGSDG